jgi:hypothetical protein
LEERLVEVFRILRDRYSVSREELNKVMIDEEDGITLADALRDPPPIRNLDDYFLNLGWYKEEFLPRNNSDEKTKEESMRELKEMNKSFGNINWRDTVASLMGVNMKQNVYSMEEEKDEGEGSEEEMRLDWGKLKLGGVIEAMKLAMKDEYLNEDENIKHERTDIIDVMERIILNSMKTSIEILKTRVKKNLQLARAQDNERKFHLILIDQIRLLFQDEDKTRIKKIWTREKFMNSSNYDRNKTWTREEQYQNFLKEQEMPMSDSMLIILYNLIIRDVKNVGMVSPRTDLMLNDNIKLEQMKNIMMLEFKKPAEEWEEMWSQLDY